MIENQLTLESENFFVDYLAFNLKNASGQISKIAQLFLNEYGFNYDIFDSKLQRLEPLYLNEKNQYKLTIVKNVNQVNSRTIQLQFKSKSSRRFYDLLKTEEFSLKYFDFTSLVLSRLDIAYIRPNPEDDDFQLRAFFIRSIDNYKKRYPDGLTQVFGDDSKESLSCSIGARTGNHFLRIYQPNFGRDGLIKFELEIKKTKARQLTTYFLHNSYTYLEDDLSNSFIRYLKRVLVLDTCYTDWFLLKLRRADHPKTSLVSTHMNPLFISHSNESLSFSPKEKKDKSEAEIPFKKLKDIEKEKVKEVCLYLADQLKDNKKFNMTAYLEGMGPNTLYASQGYRIRYDNLRKPRYFKEYVLLKDQNEA